MAIAINGSGTLTGVSVGGLPNGIVDNDMIANSTIAEAKLAANVNTITMVDQWRLTSALALNNSSGSHITIAANLERIDSVGNTTLNGGMTHSSGIWTFPETGIYKVEYVMTASCTGSTDYVDVQMKYDYAGGGYVDIARILQNIPAASNYCTGYMSAIVDVNNTSNCKLQFRARSQASGAQLTPNTNINYNYATFTRLGDT